jgi:hypothetical protein
MGVGNGNLSQVNYGSNCTTAWENMSFFKKKEYVMVSVRSVLFKNDAQTSESFLYLDPSRISN